MTKFHVVIYVVIEDINQRHDNYQKYQCGHVRVDLLTSKQVV